MTGDDGAARSKDMSRLTRRALSVTAILAGAALLAFAGLFAYWRLTSDSGAGRLDTQAPPGQLGTVIPGRDVAGPASAYASLYPGSQINPRYWDAPESAGPEPFGAPGIPAGFTPVSSRDPVAARLAGDPATRISIPAIGLDSSVSDLELLNLGDQSSYETPNNTVGHIPQTPEPGELGSGWFFGHLESFGIGEGNVFKKLPEIVDLIKNDPVDIFIQTDDADYMYRVTSTSQVKQEDLALTRSDNAQVVLVTCWPSHIYDHRLLVHAELIAVRRG